MNTIDITTTITYLVTYLLVDDDTKSLIEGTGTTSYNEAMAQQQFLQAQKGINARVITMDHMDMDNVVL